MKKALTCSFDYDSSFLENDFRFESFHYCMLQVIASVLSQEKSPLGIWQAQRVIVAVLGTTEIWDFLDQDKCKVRNCVNATDVSYYNYCLITTK